MILSLNIQECLKILGRNYIGHLGYIYQNMPFVIPITYYFDKNNSSIIAYSGDGHKMKALRLKKALALEVSEVTTVNDWKSVLVHGTFEELKGPDAKYELHKFSLGVKDLIAKKEYKTLSFIPEFSSKVDPESLPIVYRINIQEITGKKRNPKKPKKTVGTIIN